MQQGRRGQKRPAAEQKGRGATKLQRRDDKESKAPAGAAAAGESRAPVALNAADAALLNALSQIPKDTKLPTEFLPADYLKKTIFKDIKRAFLPYPHGGVLTKRGLVIDENGKKLKDYTLDFFAVSGKNKTGIHSPIKGVVAPASVRAHAHEEMEGKGLIYEDTEANEVSMCMTHGQSVLFSSFHSDHLKSAQSIVNWLAGLTAQLNQAANPDEIIRQGNLGDYFIKIKGKYYGTLYLYKRCYNDVSNLWLICGACNVTKSAAETLAWLRQRWTFGEAFYKHLTEELRIDPKTFAQQGSMGVAKIATDWFCRMHAVYLQARQTLDQKVIYPITDLQKQVLKAKEFDKKEEAEQLELEMRVKTHLAAGVVGTNLKEKILQLHQLGLAEDDLIKMLDVATESAREGYLKSIQQQISVREADVGVGADLPRAESVSHSAAASAAAPEERDEEGDALMPPWQGPQGAGQGAGAVPASVPCVGPGPAVRDFLKNLDHHHLHAHGRKDLRSETVSHGAGAPTPAIQTGKTAALRPGEAAHHLGAGHVTPEESLETGPVEGHSHVVSGHRGPRSGRG